MIGTIGLSLYSMAKTVAAANAAVVWPEGKPLENPLLVPLVSFEVKGPWNLGSASVVGSASTGRCRPVKNLIKYSIAPAVRYDCVASNVVVLTFSFFAMNP